MVKGGRGDKIAAQVKSAFARNTISNEHREYEVKGDSKYDHRTINVYNIPFLVREKDTISGSILYRYVEMLIDAREAITKAKIESIRGNKNFRDTFKRMLEEKLRDREYCQQLADDLRISVDEVISSLSRMTDPENPDNIFFSRVRLSEVLGRKKELDPLDAAVLLYTGVLSHVGKCKDRRTEEKQENIDYALRLLFERMTSSNCLWRSNNLLVVAIDRRQYCSWLLWNRKRTNHGAWVDFTNVSGLANAPTVRCDDDLDKSMSKLSQIYKALQLEDGKINLNLLVLCLKGEKSLSEVIQGSPKQLTLRVNKEVQTEENEL